VRLAVGLTLALLGAACAKKAPPLPTKPTIVIEGRVAWADRSPAVGVLVEGMREANDRPCRTTSVEGGAFRLECPELDWVRVVAIPQATGRIELVPDFTQYQKRLEPYTGVELFANRPK
jgi:hypothetical protein